MFWRILFQLVRVGRTRLLLALGAVVSGAAVCSALLNIHFDAERKMTQEFTTLGPNIVVSAKQQPGDLERPLLDESAAATIQQTLGTQARTVEPVLYLVGHVSGKPVIVAGARSASEGSIARQAPAALPCLVGRKAATSFVAKPDAALQVSYAANTFDCGSVELRAESGSEEDSQLVMPLQSAQSLASLPGKATLIRVRVAGTPEAVTAAVQKLSAALPHLEVRAIRQIAEAEGQIFGRIRGLIFATVVLILALTSLCVLSTMTALAMQHRRDVGLMRALGGEMNRILRLFLCEILALGVAGGLLGWLVGVALSAWVGWQVFDAAISPRAEVLPLVVALITAAAMLGALPLRLLAQVRPGVILRGD